MKILVADDEKYTRRGLINSIHWDLLGIDCVMQAADGKEALEIAGWLEPDIVLTDVKMPQMDGIEFVERLLEIQPEVKVLFMSSYMEVPYLKSAIRLSAVDYIEKPVNIAKVEEALAGILEEVKEKVRVRESIRESIEMKRQTYAVMLTYPFASEDNQVLFDMLDTLNITSAYRYFACLILESGCDLAAAEVEKLFEKEKIFCACGKRRPFHYVLVLGWKFAQSKEKLTEMGKTCLAVGQVLRVGIGEGTESLSGLPSDYQCAAESLERSFFLPEEQIFCGKPAGTKAPIDLSMIQEFSVLLNNCSPRLPEWLDERKKRLIEGNHAVSQVESLYYSFLMLVEEKKPGIAGKMAIAKGQVSGTEELWGLLKKVKNIHVLHNMLREALEFYLQESDGDETSRIIRDVKRVVHGQFSDPGLGVAQIAEAVRLTPAYLSTLFKARTGMSLKTYITDYRIEQAKAMLLDNKQKVWEISEACGYTTSGYFVSAFKKEVGCSPSEYREKML